MLHPSGSHMNPLNLAIWTAGPLAQLAILAIMWRRRLHKEFPVFFSYTAFTVFSTTAMFAFARGPYVLYFRAYWTMSGLSLIFGLAVIYEAFIYSFRPYQKLLDFGRVLFRWAAMVVIMVGVIMAIGSTSVGMNLLLQSILTTERSIRIMQCGLVLLLLFFAPHLGLSWRSRIFGISLGFGFFAAVGLVGYTVRSHYGMAVNSAVTIAVQASYLCAIAIWMGYMLAPEPARRPLAYSPQSVQWNYALTGVAQSTADPLFLSHVESTVERIMRRRVVELKRPSA